VAPHIDDPTLENREITPLPGTQPDTTVSAAQNRVFQGPRLLLRNPSQSLAENARDLIMFIRVELS
jgi:hypothetical protein